MSCKLTIFLIGRRILSMVMIFSEVQYCPDIVQGLLADYEVVHRCRSSCFVFYYVGGQMD